MRALVIIAVALALADIPTAGAAEVTGRPDIISGDTLVVSGKRFRLYGVDAPEAGQHCRLANGKPYDCGLVSRTALMDLTAGVSITCRPRREMANGATYATCFAGGYDLSHGMAHTGWALAFPAQGTLYVRVQERARKAARGLWRGAFVKPWDWRNGTRLPATAGTKNQ